MEIKKIDNKIIFDPFWVISNEMPRVFLTHTLDPFLPFSPNQRMQEDFKRHPIYNGKFMNFCGALPGPARPGPAARATFPRDLQC